MLAITKNTIANFNGRIAIVVVINFCRHFSVAIICIQQNPVACRQLSSNDRQPVTKNWRLDIFQCLWILLQSPIFVDKVSASAEFINSLSTGLILNGMDADDTSTWWKIQPDTTITLGEDNSNLYLLNFLPTLIQGPSWLWKKPILSSSANITHQTELLHMLYQTLNPC